ncbi:protein phosphatase 2C domain-containing protein [Sphingopyxis granuli]|uniref:PP2C family protein-serine/threonine phosphatase n=1 Tax=Sphingopyxis granuli TaxID=267128 RepID=UPI001F5304D9|nr:protein phosphatase 2C domain-containing protein [Sphingopyxis granuli]UNK79502.1 protein phosphatase 2C domain-containing protein [Sphingopyxis granuli]
MACNKFDYFAGEDIGCREHQEDMFDAIAIEDEDALLMVLADGMGGHAAGEVASQTAIERFIHTFRRHPAASIAARLGASLQASIEGLDEAVQLVPEFGDMGCTIVGTFVAKDQIHWISVGDSPLYLFRSGSLRQLNEDHSLAQILDKAAASGEIPRSEADNHPDRQTLLSVLAGYEMPTKIDCPMTPTPLMPGDTVVLASDGLQTLSDEEIAEILASDTTAQETTTRLIAAVKAKDVPGQDNIAIQLVRL